MTRDALHFRDRANYPRQETQMKRTLLTAGTLILLALPAVTLAAGDAAAGKAKAAACGGCHGANGEGKANYPALAGKPEAETAKALEEYKAGTRKGTVMPALAKSLSEQDMANLGAFYASLKK